MASIARFDEWQYTSGARVNTVVQVVNKFVVERSSWGVTTSGVVITPLRVTITPKLINSVISIQWMMNYEAVNNTVFRIYKNGALATNGTGNDSNIWTGLSAASYDTDNNSTPSNNYIQFADLNVGSLASTYYDIVAFPSDSAASTFWLNRTFNNAGSSSFEGTASSAICLEIAQ
jgi:hypothetical protein